MPDNAIWIPAEDRFDRLRRIEWWDQERLAQAHVLVVGAGALGNEILKNLALLGIGNIVVIDHDNIERSNLSRSVLFRESELGRPKVEAAARSVRDIYPEARVYGLKADILADVGLGVFRWADVVIAGLDSREARLHVNRCCYLVGRPWCDGATEYLRGVARTFVPPGGACYECTLSGADWEALRERRGCSGMSAEANALERVPTTPTTAALVAAVQCQEALKLLHGLNALDGRGFVVDGLIGDAYVVDYARDPECVRHEPFDEIVKLDASAATTTAGDVLEIAERHLGSGAVVTFSHEVLLRLLCAGCGAAESVFRPLASVPERRATCPDCGRVRRPECVSSIRGDEGFLDRTLVALGVPLFDILSARRGEREVGLEFSLDQEAVLRPDGAHIAAEGGKGS